MYKASVSQNIDVVYSLAGESDYEELKGGDGYMKFIHDNRHQSFSVTIIDDSSMEDTESFSIELMFQGRSNDHVILYPSVSVVTIVDNDEPGMAMITIRIKLTITT